MTSHQTSGLVGAVFGLVFVLVNAGNLPAAVAVVVRVLAIGSFIWLFIALRRAGAPRAEGQVATAPRLFGRRYLLVVAAEVAAALAGILVINLVLHTPHATVAWISLVVGLHFFGLAAVWRAPSLRLLAAAMAACGAAGLVLAACAVPLAVIATVAGILPGVLLLGSVWWGVRSAPAATAAIS
ncbi:MULTISPECIES: hypothetical protein [Streptomyces]|uniref:Uncharacterized protein n=1 Tax=Streptomyces spororaveus TaxID=284039 RepID=A0ABQ3T8F9_9ACTN|nr:MULTISPECIES: hypothetical protein [Streptomyces]MCM9082871.1 hypothetical protein [Streptomyces spororaveus]MCX5302360.1 hypothetical protein [Streptomyces sp. NBC_00160]GHI76700.1 hypothetical protein Sspor_22610 [Streptomyces spororaveus]